MTQQEFQTRVQMTVSVEEFEAVNEVYLNSDLNKDDFCQMWVKMNKSRVERAKAEAKAQAAEAAKREKLYDILNRYYSSEEYDKPACEVLSKRQMKVVGEITDTKERVVPYWMTDLRGIIVDRRLYSIIYDIKKYLKVA
ncbi:MAG: hypothetical protein IKP36_04985 [Bacteroidaceae bacterium]|nr:hypothetical protein [Bacteroidaceae bacterium]